MNPTSEKSKTVKIKKNALLFASTILSLLLFCSVLAMAASGPDSGFISAISSSNITSSSSTISWTTNEASDTQVEYGTTTDYGYLTTLNTNLVTSHSQALSGLSDSTLYHYRLKSKDAARNLVTSADQTFTTSAPPDISPPIISAILSSDIASSSANIYWSTNESSDTQVEYGTTTDYGYSTTLDTNLVTSHSQALSGLSDSTLYHYRVKSKDAAGNLATSPDQTFTTSGPDSGVIASWKFDENIGTIATDSSGNNNNGAIIEATRTQGMDDNALSFNGNSNYVEVQKSTSLDSINEQITIEAWIKTPLTTRETIVEKWLYNPTNDRSYVLTVETDGTVALLLSADGMYPSSAGDLSSSDKVPANTWTHIAVTSDGTTMRAYINGNPDPNTAASPAGGIYVSNTNLHLGVWQYSPTDKTAYFSGSLDQVRIYNRALSGEEILADYNAAASSGSLSISPVDTTPLNISAIISSDVTSNGATITWTTNEESDSQVEYGTTTSYGSSTTLNTNLVTSHSQAPSGLSSSTLYHYRVKSKDAAGNLVTSTDQTFTTSGPDTGLKADWRFDENIGTTATDSSVNSNDGTISGATRIVGKIDNALSFDGVNDYVDGGNGASLNSPINQITIESWVYPKLLSESYIVSKFNGDNVLSGYNLLITQSNIYFRLGDGTTMYQFVTAHGMSTNTWYHVVAVYDGTSMKIYKNGIALPGSTLFSGNIGTNTYNANIGQRVGSNSYNWNGYLDEVKIYNRALSTSEVLVDYNAASSSITPPNDSSDATPPTVSAISSSNIASSSAIISWTTNELSDTEVEYGTTANYGSSTSLNTNLVTSHSQSLSRLSASTLYHYRVKSKDAAGNLVTSGDYTFTTTSRSSAPLKLTIDHTKIDESLSDFPLLVHLGKSFGASSVDTSFVLNELGSDANRKKISITTDSDTELYVEIEKWDSVNSEAWLWVKVPYISSSVDTVLNLYYIDLADNSAFVGDVGSVPSQQVWANGFVSVQHLSEVGDGTLGEYVDSTSRGNSGHGGSTDAPTRVTGKIGYGQHFDGVDDYIEIPDDDDFSITTTGSFSISYWFNPHEDNPDPVDWVRFFNKGSGDDWEWYWVMQNVDNNNPPRLRFYTSSPEGGQAAGDYTTTDFTLNEWRYITANSESTDARHGVNHVFVDDARYTGLPELWESPRYNINYVNGDAPVIYGGRGPTDDWFDSSFDEVRFSNVIRSQAWMKASYYSESDALLS